MKYRFNKKNHRHELLIDGQWQMLTGITSVLEVLAKPALIDWAANTACEYVKENLRDLKNLDEVLKKARKVHCLLKNEAGNKGAEIHQEIEKILKKSIQKGEGIVLERGSNKQVNLFIEWALKNRVKFLASEFNVYSSSLFLGGIIDFICEIDGQKWIGDVKTTNQIYPEFFWQTAGYQMLLEEMNLFTPILGHIILRLGRNGELEEKRSISNEDNREAFLACLKIYRLKQKVEGNLL